MAVPRTASTSKDRVRTAELMANLGFEYDRIPSPAACSINRYGFELMFDTIRNPEINGQLSPDHLEHGFKIVADAAGIEGLEPVKLIVNHLFMRTFLEIMAASNRERAAVFVRRQGPRTTFPSAVIEQMTQLGQNQTDSFEPIFEHILGPREFDFPAGFLAKMDEFVDENTAPAVRYLLRPFFSDYPDRAEPVLHSSKVVTRQPCQLWGCPAERCEIVEEVALPMMETCTHAFAKFEVTHDLPVITFARPRFVLPHLPTLVCMCVPKCAEYVAGALETQAFAYSCDSLVYFVDGLGTMKELEPHGHAISAVAISDDGSLVLSCDIKGYVKVHDTAKGTSRQFDCARSLITACAFSRGPPKIAVIGAMSGVLMAYDVARGEIVRMFIGHTAGIVSLEMHANWAFIASASCDGTVRVWSLTQGCCVRLMKAAGAIPTSMRWSHSGKCILTTANDGAIAIADVGTGTTIKTVKVSDYGITLADFSMNDEMVLCHDRLGTFSIWDVKPAYPTNVAQARIDRVRPLTLTCTGNNEFRILGCCKK